MKYSLFLIVGILFGIVLTKAEIVSWFRIQEMFRFDSFHMYGIIGSALVIASAIIWASKKFSIHSLAGEPIAFKEKEKTWQRYIIGGSIFGMGWALTGACPGPMYALIGQGYLTLLVVAGSALLGTYVYGLTRHKLPH